jgi:hypothetical protein
MFEKYSKILGDCPADKTFKTSFGELKNIKELRTSLCEKGNSLYSEYANASVNHFSNWIADVFEDHELAKSLKNSESHEHALKAITTRLDYLSSWMEYNGAKEKLSTYLSSNYIFNSEGYSPSHHTFETLSNFDFTVPGIIPPPASILPSLIKSPEIGPKPIGNEPSPHLKPTESKLGELKFDELKLIKKLEEQFPGVKVINEPQAVKRGMMQKFNVFRRFRF